MTTNLIDEVTTHMQTILEHFDSDHAQECIHVVNKHLMQKLAVILESQEKMMESFMFQQKMIASLIPNKYESAFVCDGVQQYGREIPTILTMELAKNLPTPYTKKGDE